MLDTQIIAIPKHTQLQRSCVCDTPALVKIGDLKSINGAGSTVEQTWHSADKCGIIMQVSRFDFVAPAGGICGIVVVSLELLVKHELILDSTLTKVAWNGSSFMQGGAVNNNNP